MPSEVELYRQGIQFFQAGDIPNAENIFRQVLAVNPHHAQSLHMMGMVAFSVERYDLAEEFVRSAVAEQDNVPNFYFTLGRILNRQDKREDAALSYKKAISLKPDYTDALNNLGTILMSLGSVEEASDIFTLILKMSPHDFNAHANMGSILHGQAKYEEAIEHFRHALAIHPSAAKVHYDIGWALKALDKKDEALLSFQKALEYEPDHLGALLQCGMIFHERADFDRAIYYYKRIRDLRPQEDTYANVVRLYYEQGNYVEGIAEAENALKVFPRSVMLLRGMGDIYSNVAAYQEALDCFERALTIDPDDPKTYIAIGVTYKNIGRLEESIAMQRKAVELLPDEAWAYSNLLLTMVYAASVSPEELTDESFKFGEIVADKYLRVRPFANNKDPERRLRIGFVSPDFRRHAVNYFLAPIFKLSKDQFEVFAYSKVQREDEFTDQLKKKFDVWRDIKTLSDDAAADRIEEDRIDILVDVTGHTAYNSLMVFARKPAPIQVTWLGHPATSGMKAMDYRLTDYYAEPPEMTEHLNRETLWRMPEIFCAYSTGEINIPVIDNPPFDDNGYVTFGCFNNFTKVTDQVLKCWAEIMAEIPSSRLLLEIAAIDNEKIKTGVIQRLQNCGLPLERVILEQRKMANQFVLYNKIDIALDPFPCNGGTTSMDTLWMGVPLVSLAGRHFASRMGVTILTNAGLPELVASTTKEYVSIAADLARDTEKLRSIRLNLRDRVMASPLMNQERFAKNLGDAFRQMWRKWVKENP